MSDMKPDNHNSIRTIVLLVVANLAPGVINVVLYRYGGSLDLRLFPMLIGLLAFLNYRFTQGLISLVLLELLRSAAFVASSMIKAQLFYLYVSADGISLAVGMLLTVVFGVLSAVAALTVILFRLYRMRQQKKYGV